MKANSDSKKEVQQTFLNVVTSDGAVHLLPYGHLVHVQFTETNKDGISHLIEMRFAIHTVYIEGSGLHGLLDKIQNMTLVSVAKGAKGEKGNVTKVRVIDRSEKN